MVAVVLTMFRSTGLTIKVAEVVERDNLSFGLKTGKTLAVFMYRLACAASDPVQRAFPDSGCA